MARPIEARIKSRPPVREGHWRPRRRPEAKTAPRRWPIRRAEDQIAAGALSGNAARGSRPLFGAGFYAIWAGGAPSGLQALPAGPPLCVGARLAAEPVRFWPAHIWRRPCKRLILKFKILLTPKWRGRRRRRRLQSINHCSRRAAGARRGRPRSQAGQRARRRPAGQLARGPIRAAFAARAPLETRIKLARRMGGAARLANGARSGH